MDKKLFDIDGMVKDVYGMFLSLIILGMILGVILNYMITKDIEESVADKIKVGCENNVVTYYYKGESGPALAKSETNKYMECEEL